MQVHKAPETIRGPATQSPFTHLAPGSVLAMSRPVAVNRKVGMLSSHLIGPARCHGSTALYIRTPLPRARQTHHAPFLIITSLYPAYPVFSPCQPCIKWMSSKPASKPTPSNSSQLPQPLPPRSPNSPPSDQLEKHIRTMKDPVARTNSPYTDPSVKGPRSQLLSSGRPSNLSSSSNMLANPVNKTGLHPGGVVPHVEHTELGMLPPPPLVR